MIDQLLSENYPFLKDPVVEIFGTGLINSTWLVTAQNKQYILQKINTLIFKNPQAIDNNICLIKQHLRSASPEYYFVAPLANVSGNTLTENNEKFYRLFPFVEGSHSYTTATNTQIAYEAAKQFGKFTCLLSGIDLDALQITLSDFHNLSLRQQQFENAIQQASAERLFKAKDCIERLNGYKYISSIYNDILQNPAFKKRVTHHDTKISNVLFNAENKAICVIDLDTIMPGYFISDVGDMMRTYLSPAGEEETDMEKVFVRPPFFEAIVKGYLSEMKNELTTDEKQHFIYAGKFMIYMQALRFAADYLNNDVYYGAKYETHNLNRAINQLTLLESLTTLEPGLNNIVAACIAE